MEMALFSEGVCSLLYSAFASVPSQCDLGNRSVHSFSHQFSYFLQDFQQAYYHFHFFNDNIKVSRTSFLKIRNDNTSVVYVVNSICSKMYVLLHILHAFFQIYKTFLSKAQNIFMITPLFSIK